MYIYYKPKPRKPSFDIGGDVPLYFRKLLKGLLKLTVFPRESSALIIC